MGRSKDCAQYPGVGSFKKAFLHEETWMASRGRIFRMGIRGSSGFDFTQLVPCLDKYSSGCEPSISLPGISGGRQ